MSDKRGRILCFSPTAEEAAVYMVRHYPKSYRQLPLVIYQIGAKYRDERPERGLNERISNVRCL
ncbi:MAG: aminoacyl--tRNA ligase-related protein [Candidatus Aenigmatarchaeota archaeon]